MQEKHLTYEEFKLYLDTGDMSDEYLGKVESISQHLGECEQCQSMLEKVILMDSVCEEETLAYGMDLLKKEADIRRELFSEKIKKAEEEILALQKKCKEQTQIWLAEQAEDERKAKERFK